MADITINIPAPVLTAGQYFKERHRQLPSGGWGSYTSRSNAPFTVTGLSAGDYEFEFILVNADETECPAVYRRHTLITDYECISFASEMKKINGVYLVEITYTLPPGFTDPVCGWEVELIQNGSTTNKFTYATLPVSGVIKIPCANIAGLLYIRANMCNGRIKNCHGNDVAHFPDPPCVPMTGVVITVEEVFENGRWEYYLKVSFIQSVPATTGVKLDYRQWNAINGDRFNGTVNIAPGATSFRRKLSPAFKFLEECTRYYVTVTDTCNNGLPVQIDWCRTHEYEER